MNRADQERWDRKYRERVPAPEITPDPFLVSCVQGLSGGTALDVACGFGDNAIYLAGRGFEVTAIDISQIGLQSARKRATAAGAAVRFVWTDAEDFSFEAERFDLISAFFFLNRPVFAGIKRALKPGGVFVYRTFTVDELRYRPELSRHYLLEKGELPRCFADFEICLYKEIDTGKAAVAECMVKKLDMR